MVYKVYSIFCTYSKYANNTKYIYNIYIAWEDYAYFTTPEEVGNYTSTYQIPNESPTGTDQLLYYTNILYSLSNSQFNLKVKFTLKNLH